MMKLVHDSAYPQMTFSQFYRLMGDDAYQDALSQHGKLGRENVQYAPRADGLESSWDTCVHRTLKQAHLAPLRAVFPHGVEVRYSERHGYKGDQGWLKLKLTKPNFPFVKVDIEGSEQLTMQGDTLMRRIEIDFGKARLPLGLGNIPGVQSAVAKEVDAGLTRSDERTQTWLQVHRHDYNTPTATPAHSDTESDTDDDAFEDAVTEPSSAVSPG